MSELRSISRVAGTEQSERLIEDAAEIARDIKEGSELIGYVIVGMYRDGAGRTAGMKPGIDEHRIGSALWRSWVGKAIDHHFTYGEGVDAAYAVLSGDA